MNIVTDLKILRQVSEEPTRDEVPALAELLFAGMAIHNGQGLAAIQLGIPKRILVMATRSGPPICLVDPRLKYKGAEGWREQGLADRLTIAPSPFQESNEACLSVPRQIVRVKRPAKVKVRALNQYGVPVRYEFTGLEARIVCHEIDHLNGRLIIDYKEEK